MLIDRWADCSGRIGDQQSYREVPILGKTLKVAVSLLHVAVEGMSWKSVRFNHLSPRHFKFLKKSDTL